MRQKLLLAVVLAVLLPLVLFSIFLDSEIRGRLTRQVVEEALLAQARSLAADVDDEVDAHWTMLELVGGLGQVGATLDVYRGERSYQRSIEGDLLEEPVLPYGPALIEAERKGERPFPQPAFDAEARRTLADFLTGVVALEPAYDLFALLDEEGLLVASNLSDGQSIPFERSHLETIFGHSFAEDPAVAAALDGDWGVRDLHASSLGQRIGDDPAARLHVAFAIPVWETLPSGATGVSGVLYSLVNWSSFEPLLTGPTIKDTFRGLLPDRERQPSPYAWIWGSDADTIFLHPERELIGKSLEHDLGLSQMREDVIESASGWGLFRRYAFAGEDKSAAFHRTQLPDATGFGWVVGVGIEDADVYARASELRSILFTGTALVLVVVLLWALYVSNRMTAPILALQRFAGRVADGDWSARNEVESRDEVGLLARDLNAMAERLEDQRDQLVAVEKDAAWREMARQIAHDIKNPLTPIQLSLDLLERARAENAPDSEAILKRTISMVRRQITHLKEIANDFHEFTGGRPPVPTVLELGDLMREVLALHDAWSLDLGVEVALDAQLVTVHADEAKLRRVFVNLVSNALQAMPDGGRLDVSIAREEADAVVRVRDTGEGISDDVRTHLFEPYFTTKSEGTGLGLAISRRVVEASGGTIGLEPASGGRGTVAVVRLPAQPS